MARTIVYWLTTGLAAASGLLALMYLTGSPQVVQGFNHLGYPQQLRVILGIAKPLAAITLLVPGFVRLKEWAYAGLAYAWTCATVAHFLAKDGPEAFFPVLLLVLLFISYMTRPASRQWQAKATAA